MSDKADWDHWLQVIDDQGVNLTTWEENFIERLQEKREHGWRLSDREAELLEHIYAENTP